MKNSVAVVVFSENRMRILIIGEKFNLMEVPFSWDLNQIKNIKV